MHGRFLFLIASLALSVAAVPLPPLKGISQVVPSGVTPIKARSAEAQEESGGSSITRRQVVVNDSEPGSQKRSSGPNTRRQDVIDDGGQIDERIGDNEPDS